MIRYICDICCRSESSMDTFDQIFMSISHGRDYTEIEKLLCTSCLSKYKLPKNTVDKNRIHKALDYYIKEIV